MDLKSVIVVGLGSFVGGSLRYVASTLIDRKVSGGIPWSVLFVNVLGSFLIGVAAALFANSDWAKDSSWPLFISVGVLGGFTTFSTFSLQTMRLAQEGSYGLVAANVLANVSVCLVSVYCGLKLGGRL